MVGLEARQPLSLPKLDCCPCDQFPLCLIFSTGTSISYSLPGFIFFQAKGHQNTNRQGACTPYTSPTVN